MSCVLLSFIICTTSYLVTSTAITSIRQMLPPRFMIIRYKLCNNHQSSLCSILTNLSRTVIYCPRAPFFTIANVPCLAVTTCVAIMNPPSVQYRYYIPWHLLSRCCSLPAVASCLSMIGHYNLCNNHESIHWSIPLPSHLLDVYSHPVSIDCI